MIVNCVLKWNSINNQSPIYRFSSIHQVVQKIMKLKNFHQETLESNLKISYNSYFSDHAIAWLEEEIHQFLQERPIWSHGRKSRGIYTNPYILTYYFKNQNLILFFQKSGITTSRPTLHPPHIILFIFSQFTESYFTFTIHPSSLNIVHHHHSHNRL